MRSVAGRTLTHNGLRRTKIEAWHNAVAKPMLN
jgi:hypothetical protein